jgi:hypothetical protein
MSLNPVLQPDTPLVQKVAEELEREKDYVIFNPLYQEPDRVYACMVVYADGVEWQPDAVNGEGLYRRNIANAAWVFIG